MRDPRVDPQIGDRLRTASTRKVVLAVDAEYVTWRFSNGRKVTETMADWRKWAKRAKMDLRPPS